MGFRLTTWNVNGIRWSPLESPLGASGTLKSPRNPFGYQPWRDQKTFAAMFDVLEADIVVFQETKIQRKDLNDDMVLVPGWDCYWSLPKHKKGYSGVVIYTRQSKCAPIRAEEGITGTLCSPNSSTSFVDQPEGQQIGGYPTHSQLASSAVDATTIDSEGRCVILEFPAFVLLGVYSPAARNETRDEFRLGFLNLLDARVRNLVAMGKRVILTGDLNISKEPLDNANPEAAMRKNDMTVEEYISTPSRRLFNHLLEGGKVIGDRDKGREESVMWDICRAFHPTRTGMFTCWEQKVNARPGNHGSRIDYVLCSLDMKKWFSDSNIQEGLMGSDHCPVYVTFRDQINIADVEVPLLDHLNPAGMFLEGRRQREYTTKDILPMSGKLIREFDGRRSIRDMFTRKLSVQRSPSKEPLSADCASTASGTISTAIKADDMSAAMTSAQPVLGANSSPKAVSTVASTGKKRSAAEEPSSKPLKRSKSGSAAAMPRASGKGQQSLKGFFKPKTCASNGTASTVTDDTSRLLTSSNSTASVTSTLQPAAEILLKSTSIQGSQQLPATQLTAATTPKGQSPTTRTPSSQPQTASPSPSKNPPASTESPIHDPIVSKESWSKLFTKPVAPRCEGHDEPCITLLTKKSGMNCGRSFWMCPRPLGPSGAKEKNTQWRCQTFIWCSDWNPGNP